MGDRNPTTTHMESKKGGRPDKVDKDSVSRQHTDDAYSRMAHEQTLWVSYTQVAIQNVLSMMETKGGQVAEPGFVAQTVLSIINENFAYYSQSTRQARINQALFEETLATMSWAGQITTAFNPESQTLVIINFRPNDAADGLKKAGQYKSHGDKDQKEHARRFFDYYSPQQRALADQQLENDSIEVTIHEKNWSEQQQRYEDNVVRSSSYDTLSVNMR